MRKDYVLITPAHNEEKNIERTIKSVVNQTIIPNKWIIVDDGSTDKTNEIIKRYESEHDFITSLRTEHTNTETYYGHITRVVLAIPQRNHRF